MIYLYRTKEVMKMSKKQNKPRNSYEVNRSIRRDWGEISPVTKIIPNKKKNHKEKHRKEWDEE